MRVVKGIFVTRDRPFLFPVKCEMALFFFSWIVTSIAAVNRDFPKCSLLFSVKREMLILYFSWIVKGLFYFPWNVIYTPPLLPSEISRTPSNVTGHTWEACLNNGLCFFLGVPANIFRKLEGSFLPWTRGLGYCLGSKSKITWFLSPSWFPL